MAPFIDRRFFLRASLTALGSAAVAGVTGVLFRRPGRLRIPGPRRVPGRILGASAKIGHLLRGQGSSGVGGFPAPPAFPAPTEELKTSVAIVGGGISGLSAAWSLGRLGIEDYLLFELESEAGGNARGGKNAISAYPWGAHYVPLPGPESDLVLDLFRELGVITGYDAAGLPIYDEYFMCADPHERLLIYGAWQEGLVPLTGLSDGERGQVHRFFSTMEEFRSAQGRDGKPAFAIPIAKSSRDPRFTDLDRISMAEFLERNRFDAAPLKWYVNYCCRDDYGTEMREVSAWAGVHYFASRRGKASNADSQTVLTWPEGNAWLASRLRGKAGGRVRANALVFNIEQESSGGQTLIDYFNTVTGHTTRVRTEAVIYAAPRFTAGRVIRELRENPPEYLKAFTYAPWMVANVSVSSVPTGPGAPPSWDNVSYHSPSLGYITATHQALGYRPTKSVLTYYWPLSEDEPAKARQGALGKSHGEWTDLILADLEHMHPGISPQVENIDVWLWGHGMIRPRPGFIWGKERESALERHGQVFFAHSDMSGISIFEEAQYHGVKAAEAAAQFIRGHGHSHSHRKPRA